MLTRNLNCFDRNPEKQTLKFRTHHTTKASLVCRNHIFMYRESDTEAFHSDLVCIICIGNSRTLTPLDCSLAGLSLSLSHMSLMSLSVGFGYVGRKRLGLGAHETRLHALLLHLLQGLV
jgi:hypothetical protein